MTNGIGWLHFSDLHQGQPQTGSLHPNLLDALFKDLRRMVARSGPWDLVLFTGDLTFSGSSDQFGQLTKTLDRIWEELAKLHCDPALAVVPGNHDLQWPDPKRSTVKALRAWHQDKSTQHDFWGTAEDECRREVDSAFQAFRLWSEKNPRVQRLSPRSGILPGDFSAVYEKNGIRLGLVGLNSSFLQLSRDNYEGQLDLSHLQLNAVCERDPPVWLDKQNFNLLLTHHPPSWLHVESQKHFREEIQPDRFTAHLYGHMHQLEISTERRGGGGWQRKHQAASLFGMETFAGRTERRHGYDIGRIEKFNGSWRLRVWPRSLLTKQGGPASFGPTPEYELDEDGSLSEELTSNAGVSRRANGITASGTGDVESPPTESAEEALAKYRVLCFRENAHMRVSALDSGDAQRLLANALITELFVEPRLIDDAKLAARSDEEQRLQLELQTPDLTPQRQAEIKRKLGQFEKERWEGKAGRGNPEGLPLSQLLQTHARSVIVGTPGAGKTTLLRYLARTSTQAPVRELQQGDIGMPLVPMLVALRDFAYVLRKHPKLPLDKFLIGTCAPKSQSILRAALHKALVDGTALVLLDAIDEVPKDLERRRVAQAITTLLAKYPQLRCVVTTRPYGYQPVTGDISHLRLAPLSRAEMRQVIRKRAEAIGRRTSQLDLGAVRREANRIASEVESHSSVAALAKNPLLLVMICELCQNGAKLPIERAQLYEKAIATLLDRWNHWRSLSKRSSNVPPLPAHELRQALASIALRQRIKQHPVLHRALLIRWLAKALQKKGHSFTQAQSLAETYIAAAAGQAGILDERGKGQFVFWHQTFEEYLAAVALTGRRKAADTRLLARAGVRQFREVFQLALGHLALVQADLGRSHRLVRALLKEPLPMLEPVLHRRLRIAGVCVAEQSWLEAGLTNEILSRLAETVQRQPYAPIVEDLTAALRARPCLLPDPRLLRALAFILQSAKLYRYAGSGLFIRSALRVVINAAPHSVDAQRLCELLLGCEDADLRTLAGVGLLRCGQRQSQVLMMLAPIRRFDKDLIDATEKLALTSRAELEPRLRDWLRTEGPGLREPAAVLLAMLGADEPEVIHQLLSGVGDQRYLVGSRDFNSESTWLHHLAVSSEQARAQLILALKPPNAEENAAFAVLHRAAETSDEVLSALLAALEIRTAEVAPLLGSLGQNDDRVGAGLRKLLAAPQLQYRYTAAIVLRELALAQAEEVEEDIIVALTSCLGTEDPALRLRVCAQLVGVGLDDIWQYVNHYQRRPLVVLGHRETMVPRIITALFRTLSAPDNQTRAHAAVLLVLLDQVDDMVIDVLTDENTLRDNERREIWEELSPRLHAERRDRITLRLAERVLSENRYVRRWARERLRRFRELPAPTVAALRSYLESEHAEGRTTSALTLWDFGYRDFPVQQAMVASLVGLDKHERHEVVELLGKVTSFDDRIFEIFLMQLAAALVAAEPIPQAKTRETGNEVFLMNVPAWVHRAARTLASHVQEQPEQLRWLADAFTSESPMRRRAAGQLALALEAGSKRASQLDSILPRLSELLVLRMEIVTDLRTLWVLAQELHYGWFAEQPGMQDVLQDIYYRCLDHPDEHVRLDCAKEIFSNPKYADPARAQLELCVVSTDLDAQLSAIGFLLREKLQSPSLVATLHQWLWQEAVSLLHDPFAQWWPGRERGQDRPLNYIRSLLYESAEVQTKEGHRLSVNAAFWLIDLGELGNHGLRIVTDWLSHQSPLRKLYAVYLLLRMKAWPAELEVELTVWLDSDDRRLRTTAVKLLERRPKTAALVDAKLGGWLIDGLDDRSRAHELFQLINYNRCFGKAVIQGIVAWAVQGWGQLDSDEQEQIFGTIFRRRSRRARLRAALLSALAQDNFEDAVVPALALFKLGYVSNRILDVLVEASIRARGGDLPILLARSLPDLKTLDQNYRHVRIAMRGHLTGRHAALRQPTVELMHELGESPAFLAIIIRSELTAADNYERVHWARLLASLGLPEDREVIIATVLAAARELDMRTSFGGEFLSPIDQWPECAQRCQEIYALWMGDYPGESSWGLGRLAKYLGGKVDAGAYREWLIRCLAHPDGGCAAQAHQLLVGIGQAADALLNTSVAWLCDGNRHSARLRIAVNYLRSRELLDGQDGSLYHDEDLSGPPPEDPARKLQTLAREPAVVPIMAELAAPASLLGHLAVIKLRDGQKVNSAESAALATLVELRPDDDFRRRFARTWLFYWLDAAKSSRRARVTATS